MNSTAGSDSALQFQGDAEDAARLARVDQLEAAVAARPSLAALAAIFEALTQALHDPLPAVLKRAIPAAYVAFRPGHAAALRLGKGAQVADDVAAVWAGCLRARERVNWLLSQPSHASDGVRMLAAKFLENTMLLVTAEPSTAPMAPAAQHTLLSAALVAREADGTVQQLVSMIKAPGLPSLPGNISIVIIKGLGSIAQQRPQYLGRILPTLLNFAASLKQPQGDGTAMASASVVRALKDALLSVLRCRAPQALTWHNKVVAALQSLGAGEIADAEVRKAERQAKRERGRDLDDDSSAKRLRVEEPKQEPAASAPGWAQAPQQAPLQAALQAPIAEHHAADKPLLERLLHECPEATGPNELFMVIGVMSTLAKENDLHTLQGFSEGLSPSVLTDVVIANLDHIPRREDVAGAQDASSGTGALASLMQGLSDNKKSAQQPQQQQQQPVRPAPLSGDVSAAMSTSASTTAAAPAAQGTSQRAPPPGRKLPVPSKATKLAPKPIIKKPAPPQLKLKPLAPDQEAALRLGAVQRILASEAVPAQHLRSSVLAALASRAPAGDSAADLVLQHILANFRQPGSYSLALQWLYSLFVAYSQADIQAVHEAAASAHVNAPQLRAALASALDDDDMAASAAAEQRPRLSLPLPEEASAKTGVSVGSASALAQRPDPAAARQSNGPAETSSTVKQEQDNGSAAIQLAAADNAAQMDVSQGAAGLELSVKETEMQLHNSSGEAGTSGRDHAADLTGTLYETVLLAILEGLREQVSPDEKVIARLLIDSPALPHAGVMAFLRDVCLSGGDWATLALSASYDIIMKRPPDRLHALQVVLDAATGPDADVRNKAVRLVANRLYSEHALQKAITDFAASKAKEVLTAQKPHRPALQDPGVKAEPVMALPASASAAEASAELQEDSSKQPAPALNAAAALQPQCASNEAASDGSSNGLAQASEPDLAQPKVKQEAPAEDSGEEPPHQATNGVSESARSLQEHSHAHPAGNKSSPDQSVDVKQEASATTAEPMQVDISPPSAAQHREGFREGSSHEAGSASAAEENASSAVAPFRERREQPGPAAVVAAAPEQAVQVVPLSADEAAGRCELLCALCTKSPGLLRLLMEVFGKAEVNARKAISRNARLLARAVGAEAPIWVELLHRIPPKSEPLLLNMLLTLTGDTVPPKGLADACMATYARLKAARFAVPALAALDRPRALSLLPKLVQLDAVAFKAAMHRLLLTQPGKGESLLAPQEILVALLTLNPQAEGLPLKALTLALTRCFEMLDPEQTLVFHPQALASAMQQLVDRSPLPALFMRFVIQAVQTAPQLRPFVCEMLSTLVNRAVWTNGSQWKGWVRCVQDLVPDSLPVLLQLPVGNLEAALKDLTPMVAFKAEAFLESPKCGPLPKQTQAAVKRRVAAVREAAAAKENDGSGAKKEGAVEP